MKVFKVKEPGLETVFRSLMAIILCKQTTEDEQLFSQHLSWNETILDSL